MISTFAHFAEHRLSKTELRRRTSGYYDALMIQSTSDSKANAEHLQSTRRMVESLAARWCVDQAIVLVNFNRLSTIVHQLTLQSFVRQRDDVRPFSIDDWYVVLEFYLHMDGLLFYAAALLCATLLSNGNLILVECFYMPPYMGHPLDARIVNEKLFCQTMPSARQGMTRCRDTSCRFCYERLDLTHRFEPAMNFTTRQVHCFVNNYRVYLNANVVCARFDFHIDPRSIAYLQTCTTANVLYALTCPCHQYDYVGRCQLPFRDRMWRECFEFSVDWRARSLF